MLVRKRHRGRCRSDQVGELDHGPGLRALVGEHLEAQVRRGRELERTGRADELRLGGVGRRAFGEVCVALGRLCRDVLDRLAERAPLFARVQGVRLHDLGEAVHGANGVSYARQNLVAFDERQQPRKAIRRAAQVHAELVEVRLHPVERLAPAFAEHRRGRVGIGAHHHLVLARRPRRETAQPMGANEIRRPFHAFEEMPVSLRLGVGSDDGHAELVQARRRDAEHALRRLACGRGSRLGKPALLRRLRGALQRRPRVTVEELLQPRRERIYVVVQQHSVVARPVGALRIVVRDALKPLAVAGRENHLPLESDGDVPGRSQGHVAGGVLLPARVRLKPNRTLRVKLRLLLHTEKKVRVGDQRRAWKTDLAHIVGLAKVPTRRGVRHENLEAGGFLNRGVVAHS